MRVRTEAKREEILRIAAEMFLEKGYDASSMAQLSQRVGGSKATLYGYFRSKEELLLATMNFDVSEQIQALLGHLRDPARLREGLLSFGVAYLERRLSERPTGFFRIVSNRPEDSGIGAAFWQQTLRAAWLNLCQRFEELIDEGVLRRADPWVMVMHLKGLLEGDLVDRRLLGAMPQADAAEIARVAEQARDAFLRIYGVPE